MYKVENIEAVIFDIDGTILDSMPIWKDACEIYLRSIGIEPEPNIGEVVFTMTIKEGIKYSKERYNIDKTEEEIEAGLLDTIKDFYYNQANAKPGVIKLVNDLFNKNIPMVLATTGNEDLARHALERIGIMHCFKAVFTCNDYNTNKGEPLIFQIAKKRLAKELGKNVEAINNKNIYVFEDSLKAIRTVTGMGFSVIAVKDDECEKDWDNIRQCAGMIFDSLEEVEV